MIRRTQKQAQAFDALAEKEILAVLARHGVKHSDFRTSDRNRKVRYATFERGDGEFEIVICENITMTHGKQLFECYLNREFTNDDALIGGFTRRLDRFLSGGPWREPDEEEPGPIARALRRVVAALRR